MIAGNPNQGKMNRIINKDMGQYTSGMNQLGSQFGQLGAQSMDFNSGINTNQRNMLQSAAADATATGGMQAQQMAAQQGMGGSGLLQQATQNQAYSNMMGAGQKGLQAFMNQQKLGAGYLKEQGNLLGQAGSMQSDLNTSMANVESTRAANTGAMIQGGIGMVANLWNPLEG
jgi:hypothetical protein